jgi:hypothetical protein
MGNIKKRYTGIVGLIQVAPSGEKYCMKLYTGSYLGFFCCSGGGGEDERYPSRYGEHRRCEAEGGVLDLKI